MKTFDAPNLRSNCSVYFLFFIFLVSLPFPLFSKPVKNWIVLDYSAMEGKISELQQQDMWWEFLRMKEGNWMYIQFKNSDKNNYSLNFSNCKNLSKQLAAYFVGKGLSNHDVLIKYEPEAYVVVYKKVGICKNANFISLPDDWIQHFSISNLSGGICKTKNGHEVVFPAKAFIVKNGDLVNIDIYEILDKKAFVLSGYTASSSNKLLESNGMFKINAHQGHQSISLKPGIEAQIRYKEENFTNTNEKSSYVTFYGTEKNNEINWIPNYQQTISLSQNETVIPDAKNPFSSSYTETFFVQIHRKLNLLEPQLISITSGILNEKDYSFIINKYGNLQSEYNGKLTPIASYSVYKKLMANNQSNVVFIGLSAEQHQILKTEEKKAYLKAEEIKKQEEAQRLQEEKERAEKLEKEAKVLATINSHPISMKINQLGNINCDRFPEVKEKTDVIVHLNFDQYDQIKVMTIFMDIKSVIHGTYLPNDKGNITFSDLPQGKNVIYLAAVFSGKEVKMAYLSKTIEHKDVINLQLQTYTNQQYEQILSDLIPN